MSDYYILNGREPVPVSMLVWAGWFEDMRNRCVALNEFGHEAIGVYRVSTVFLGIDYNFSGVGPPVLFETMVFGPPKGDNLYCERACTWPEAEAEHQRAVEWVKQQFADAAVAAGP